MANPVNWFHISTKHADPLADFYGKAFDWKMSPGGMPGMTFADTGKGGIRGGIASNPDGSDQHSITIYVGTASLEAQLARIEQAGGKADGPPIELPPGMGRIQHFKDPVGNVVGLWESPPPVKKATTPKKAAKAAKKAKAKAEKKAAPKKAKASKAAKKTKKRAKKG